MMIAEIKNRRFDKNQYELLIRCSEKGDPEEWNEWRKNINNAPILLEGADLGGVNLPGADLSKIDLADADLFTANLRGTKLRCANLAAAIVNAETFIWGCEFDINTDFTGMDLDLARIDPRLKKSLRTKATLIQ